MSRIVFVGLICAGLALLGLTAFEYFSPDAPGAMITQTERTIPDVAVGQTIPVAFQLHNPTRHDVVVVGLAPC